MNKTVIKRVERHARNSYIHNIYFNKTKYSICTGLDYVTLSNIHPDKEILLYDILSANGFRAVKDVRLQTGNYGMKRVYENDYGDTVDIFHAQRQLSKGFNSLLITVRHPNQEIMSLLDSIFKYHEINPKVSVIEMTFDFYVDRIIDFNDSIKSHLFLKNQRSKSFTYGNTFYTNDLRNSTKGMRLYRKLLETGQRFVRLELVLHRSTIYRLGLQFPLNNIDSLNLSKFFYFARVKEDDVKKYTFRQNRRKLEQLKILDPFEAEIIEDHIESWLRYSDSLMGKVEAIRDDIMVINYSRFIKPLDDFNKKFFNIVSSQKFIPPRRRKDDPILKWKYTGVT
jgi:hypothetical protein